MASIARTLYYDRMDQCERLMQSQPTTSLVERALASQWGITRRAVRRYTEAVRKRWRDRARMQSPADIEARRLEAVARMEFIFGEAAKDRDWGSAINAAARLADLNGCKPDAKAAAVPAWPQLRPLQDMAPVELRERARGLRRVGT